MTRTRQRARRRKFAPKEAPSSADPKPKFKPIPKPKPKPTPTPPPPESESDSDPEEEEEEPSEEEEVEHQHAEPTESSSSKDSDESESDSDSDDDSKRETIKKLLEPFGKDQLISILKEASSSNPSLVSGILKSVESDPIHRKIFVHGLGWDTTSQTLLSAFLHFGPVEDCNVVTDKATGRSKGYGFLLFRTRAAARKALRQPQKRIGHRIASCQLASAGPPESGGGGGGGGGPVGGGRKLYVANVGPQISPEKLRAFFAVFGEIEDGPLGLDKAGKFRGFAMFVYKGLEGIKKALEEPLKVFEGFKLLCSVATEGRAIGKKSKPPAMAVTGTGTGAPTLAPSNVAIPAGMQVGLVAQNMNPGAVLMSQNPALGVLNPVLGMGYAPSFAGGVSQSLNRVGTAPTMGINGGFGAQPSFSGVTPSLVSGYGSQAALQGYGAYQSAQLAQPSVSAAPVAKSNPGVGSVGAPASYFGR